MTVTVATAKDFVTAFRALPKKEQTAVIEELTEDSSLLEDLFDHFLIQQAAHEEGQAVPAREYFAGLDAEEAE